MKKKRNQQPDFPLFNKDISASYSVKLLFLLKLMNTAIISHIFPFPLGLLGSWEGIRLWYLPHSGGAEVQFDFQQGKKQFF